MTNRQLTILAILTILTSRPVLEAAAEKIDSAYERFAK